MTFETEACRAVGFDLGETLMQYAGIPLNWQSLYRQALTRVWQACPTRTPLSDEVLSQSEAVLARYNTRLHPRTVEVSSRQIFTEVLACWQAAEFQGDEPHSVTIARAEDAFFGFFQQEYIVYDDTLAALCLLRESGLKIGVLTDTPYGMDRRLVERDLTPIAAYIDVTLTSVEVGHRKPAPNGFLALATALDTPPHRMLYVGNEPKDIQGARAAGMRPILLARETRDAAAATIPDYGQESTISSLSLLPALCGITG